MRWGRPLEHSNGPKVKGRAGAMLLGSKTAADRVLRSFLERGAILSLHRRDLDLLLGAVLFRGVLQPAGCVLTRVRLRYAFTKA